MPSRKPQKAQTFFFDGKTFTSACLLNDTDRDIPEQSFRQDAVLYDTVNSRIFSDKLRIIMINLRLLEPAKMGMDDEFYENVLHLMHKIAEHMTNKEALIAEIDATPYDEETKKVFRWVVNVSDLNRMDAKVKAPTSRATTFHAATSLDAFWQGSL